MTGKADVHVEFLTEGEIAELKNRMKDIQHRLDLDETLKTATYDTMWLDNRLGLHNTGA